MIKKGVSILFLLFVLLSCEKQETNTIEIELPSYFPEISEDEYSEITEDQWELGKRLFFERKLSRDNSTSCGDCHKAELAFSDGLPQSIGVEGRIGTRNAPSLFNTVFFAPYFWAGGSRDLPAQVLAPFDNEHEFDLSPVEAIERLEKDQEYNLLFIKAYGSKPNAFALTHAIAAFEATLISYNSAFDRFYFEKESDALTSREKRGWELFQSDSLLCLECHSLPFFRFDGYFNNGVFEEGDEDKGRYRITLNSEDIGKFKVPSLRNVQQTFPYMHDGRLSNLEEVILHYQKGGSDHINKDSRIRGFQLSDGDQEALIAFLKIL